MTLQEMTKAIGIDWRDTQVQVNNRLPVAFSFGLNPGDFLAFAEEDFQQTDNRNLVNAITNAKRAIDCQADCILSSLGYDALGAFPANVMTYLKRLKPNDLPVKLRLLQALDIAPPKLLAKTRKVRNMLEHEYRLPTKDEVEEAIELAQYLCNSTSSVMRSVVESFALSSGKTMFGKRGGYHNALVIRYGPCTYYGKAFFIINGWTEGKPLEPEPMYEINDDLYPVLLRLLLAVGSGTKLKEPLFDFLQAIGCTIPSTHVKVSMTYRMEMP